MSDTAPDSEDEVFEGPPLLASFGDELDTTLVDVMLSLKISDRLRTLTRCVDGLRRFHRV